MECFDWLTLVDATRDALSGNSALKFTETSHFRTTSKSASRIDCECTSTVDARIICIHTYIYILSYFSHLIYITFVDATCFSRADYVTDCGRKKKKQKNKKQNRIVHTYLTFVHSTWLAASHESPKGDGSPER